MPNNIKRLFMAVTYLCCKLTAVVGCNIYDVAMHPRSAVNLAFNIDTGIVVGRVISRNLKLGGIEKY